MGFIKTNDRCAAVRFVAVVLVGRSDGLRGTRLCQETFDVCLWVVYAVVSGSN